MKDILTQSDVLISSYPVTIGSLFLVLGFVFFTSSSKSTFWTKFYKIFPALLMCYLIPALLRTFGVITTAEVADEVGKIIYDGSNLWGIAKNYFLPASLILMILSIDLKGIANLGSKALIMFFAGTVGVVLGGVFAVSVAGLFMPEVVADTGDYTAPWRGLATVAGSWIGGGANQVAMLEEYKLVDSVYPIYVVIDIVVANIWMAFLLVGIGKKNKIDKWLKADDSAIEELKEKMNQYSLENEKVATSTDLMKIFVIGMVGVGLAHFGAGPIAQFFGSLIDNPKEFFLASKFLWLILISSGFGLALSFTKLRKLEGVGASKIASVFIYFLVAVIGMKMDLTSIAENWQMIIVGLLWMAFHVGFMFLIAKIIRAPYFFLAVGSKANIGGAASAPVVASAFHPSLAPVGVLLAVMGYIVGTFGAIACAELMQMVSP